MTLKTLINLRQGLNNSKNLTNPNKPMVNPNNSSRLTNPNKPMVSPNNSSRLTMENH